MYKRQVKYVEFEDRLNFLSKTCGNVKIFLTEDFSTKNWKRKTLEKFLRKLLITGSIEHTVMTDFNMCCLYVVLVLPGSVETQLGLCGRFC